jgi:hypothetical protein
MAAKKVSWKEIPINSNYRKFYLLRHYPIFIILFFPGIVKTTYHKIKNLNISFIMTTKIFVEKKWKAFFQSKNIIYLTYQVISNLQF